MENGNISRLRNGKLRVAVIGGGPAGSFFALHLMRYAGETGGQPEITIYQQRNFDELGPKGCKGCAGILSPSLLRNMEGLGLTVPREIIQCEVEQYTVHSPYTAIGISNPEKGGEIASIYRGGGPRVSHYDIPISFDGWLLKQAENMGAAVVYETINSVAPGEETVVETAGGKSEYDLVVLANGINGNRVNITGVGYAPPRTRRMAQQELYAGVDEVAKKLGNAAHAFLIPHSGTVFGTLVPKGPFINVSVMRSDNRAASIKEFLNHEIVMGFLPAHYEVACSCQPQALVGMATSYFGDNFVAIGDAVVTRLYKDGIGSAFITAREAARTVSYHGVRKRDFARHFAPVCRAIKGDNRWGKMIFAANNYAKNSRVFVVAQERLIGDEQHNHRGKQPFTRAAWGMFTGSYTYKAITRMALAPVSVLRMFTALLSEGAHAIIRREEPYRQLHVGKKRVLILGSGFGGTYVLRNLVPALNRNENVETTMVSNENFFLFSPLLHEVAAGLIETRHVAYPIRRLHWRDRFNFVQANVQKIDLKERRVTTTEGALEYDYLVLGLGGIAKIPPFGKLKEHGGNFFTLRSLRDAMLIRNQIIGMFEQASAEKSPERRKQLLTFLVAGAGYTGVQVVSEIRDLIYRTLTRFYKDIDPSYIRIILLESEPKIVADLHSKLGAYALKCLKEMKVELRLKSRITGAGEDRVQINNAEVVPTCTVIWVAGITASPRIAEIEADRDDTGRVLVNQFMEVPGFQGVYAVGDCANFKDPHTGQPIPPRAHTGVRQARVAAHNILADIRGRQKKPYIYSNAAEMVSLGSSKAMFRIYGLRLYGFPARLIWLGAYSLLVTGAYNRLRIITDWLLASIFGRDTTYIKL